MLPAFILAAEISLTFFSFHFIRLIKLGFRAFHCPRRAVGPLSNSSTA